MQQAHEVNSLRGESKFRRWLMASGINDKTARDIVSRCKRIQRIYEINLADTVNNSKNYLDVMKSLGDDVRTYSNSERPAYHIYGALRHALAKYSRFRKGQIVARGPYSVRTYTKSGGGRKKKIGSDLRFIDLFCGLGGFRVAAERVFRRYKQASECVFSCDIDDAAQAAYEANFGDRPAGDITKISTAEIPDHDVLFAGFPCQAFSICGDRLGFNDTRGTLFFEIARILEKKQPAAFVLENVKMLRSHDQGNTLRTIMATLKNLGYHTEYRILNALDFGVPQKRERIFFVGFRTYTDFRWPIGYVPMMPLDELLEENVGEFYFASPKIRARRLRKAKNKPKPDGPAIWHENKGGNIGIHEYSCAMRAGASYNYLLVNGERRLTEREMLRLQDFPDSYKIVCGYSETRKQAGNSVAIPVVQAVFEAVYLALTDPELLGASAKFEPMQTVIDLER
jgi:DNA (cytosine-5)-methyltransferase 1